MPTTTSAVAPTAGVEDPRQCKHEKGLLLFLLDAENSPALHVAWFHISAAKLLLFSNSIRGLGVWLGPSAATVVPSPRPRQELPLLCVADGQPALRRRPRRDGAAGSAPRGRPWTATAVRLRRRVAVETQPGTLHLLLTSRVTRICVWKKGNTTYGIGPLEVLQTPHCKIICVVYTLYCIHTCTQNIVFHAILHTTVIYHIICIIACVNVGCSSLVLMTVFTFVDFESTITGPSLFPVRPSPPVLSPCGVF